MRLTAGTWARRATRSSIDKNAADKYGFEVGDRIEGRGRRRRLPDARRGHREVRRRRLARRRDVRGLRRPDRAEAVPARGPLHDDRGRRARRRHGGEARLRAAAARPRDRSGAHRRAEAAKAEQDVAGFVKYIRYFLVAFGMVALFVGGFVIFNTLSITVAQRTRELATLRTLGASRRQVLRSVVLEAFVIGLFASAVGLLAGIGLAKGLSSLFARSACRCRRPDCPSRRGRSSSRCSSARC